MGKCKDIVNVWRRMMRIKPPGRRQRGMTNKRFMNAEWKDGPVVGVIEEDAEDRVR